jgi:hypothetical protein
VIKISSDAYHGRTDHVSKSMLDKLRRAPAVLRAYLDGERPEPTPAMVFGTAVHTAVLEPDKLVCQPKYDKRTKAGKESVEAFASEYSGQDVTIVDVDTYVEVLAIAEAVMRHPVAKTVFSEGQPEMSAFATIGGTQCKVRPDWISPTGIVVDLKTTTDASPAGFQRAVANFRYHVQAAFYLDVLAEDGEKADAFIFIAAEKTPPYLVGAYVLDTEAVEAGREEYHRDMDTYRECIESGHWWGLSPRLELLSLPKWAKPQEEEIW